MILNEIGKITEKCWRGIPDHFSGVVLDEYVIILIEVTPQRQNKASRKDARDAKKEVKEE